MSDGRVRAVGGSGNATWCRNRLTCGNVELAEIRSRLSGLPQPGRDRVRGCSDLHGYQPRQDRVAAGRGNGSRQPETVPEGLREGCATATATPTRKVDHDAERGDILPAPTSEAIHEHFGLSYANYLVLPRTLLQSMPDEWQERFVTCLDELSGAFSYVKQAETYEVTPGREVEVESLTAAEQRQLGIIIDHDGDDLAYYNRDGNQLEGWERVVVPDIDPVPYYNRGRTYIEPRSGDQ